MEFFKPMKQCCGSGMFIPDPLFPSRIPDPGSERFWIHFKQLNILTPKNCFQAFGIRSGMFIPDKDLNFLPLPDPEVKKGPDPGSGSATLL